MKFEKKPKNGIKRRQLLLLETAFFFALLWWELWLNILLNQGRPELSWGVVAFLPAMSFGLSVLPGVVKNGKVARGIVLAEMIILFLFYSAHLIYCRIFGSLIPLSMVGMGYDAIHNFGWAMQSTLRESIGWVAMFLLPVIGNGLWLHLYQPQIGRRNTTSPMMKLASTVLLWLLTVTCLPLGGTDDPSVYSAYYNSKMDTDSAALYIGVLTNSLRELKNQLPGSTKNSLLMAEEAKTEIYELPGYVISVPETIEEKLPLAMEPEAVQEKMEPEAVQEKEVNCTPNILPEVDFEALAVSAPNKELAELSSYFAAQSGSNRNKFTGMFRNYDLIYICGESFSPWAIRPEITPTLYRLYNSGIQLTNYYNSFKNTTANGEFAMLTGLWPDISRKANEGSNKGSLSESADKFMPFGLGTMFRLQLGAKAYGYHNYLGSYYNRKNSLENLGFTTKFMDDGMTFSSSWPASDLEMMQQSVDDYINDTQYVAYYMTFSGHGPYTRENVIYNKNRETLEELLNGRSMNDKAKGYLACNLELEYAMEYLLQRLEKAGRLERTVIVLAGDHYPYYLDGAAQRALSGGLELEFETSKSGAILWCGALENQEPVVNNVPCCNVDLLPTILNLFGMKYDSRLLAGRDVFSDDVHVATLYNHNLVTELLKYNYNKGKVYWTGPEEEYEKEEARAYAKTMCGWVNQGMSASVRILSSDYYDYVWTASGLKAAETDAE